MSLSAPILRCMLATLLTTSLLSPALAASLEEIRESGKIRHLGIRYANFVTGAGDGFDVDLMRGFADQIGVEYELVYSDFYSVIRDLLGKDVVTTPDGITLEGDFPVRGDVISTGFTVLPWREEVLLFSEPTFPSQVLLVAPAGSGLSPIHPSGDLGSDIAATKALIGSNSLLVMEKTCLDPSGYGLTGKGIDLRKYTASTNLNEMVPAMLNGTADVTLLDVPDVILDLAQWSGQIKILGPISRPQVLATAFPKDAGDLRDAFDDYLRQIRENGTYDALVDRYYPGIRTFFPVFF
ncbi:amino acid ABC transporter substrate-binding protein (PAAT family) [Rhodovulum euryhalinum]|uniref:Amino acid ABC transporter substrate-binding protein (PAAT family) n=1 Tax=Rhodovulum euryhalinum TaxID=35805 RepID=A0A4R2KPJ3_9RHOB|nr:amino acid ABC transporter substrate-binding protein (PAAT family) [Rhodovulum euryhalinum]